MSSWEFLSQKLEIREKEVEALFTFSFVNFFVWFANFCLEIVVLKE